ncbi:MAG: glycosyltransferase [Burkholderiales bacterium]
MSQLLIVPSVPVWTHGDAFVFDRKFYDGLMRYVAEWRGDVACLAWRAEGGWPQFGTVRKTRDDLPLVLTLLEPGTTIGHAHLAESDVVLAAADDHRQLEVAALCREVGARCVYVIEYIPETRHQIVALETRNPLVRVRRHLFVRRSERRRREAFALASGLQANGTAAHEAYAAHGDPLLYFDTRIAAADLVTDEELSRRLHRLATGAPLQLAFSGRLIAMKGADHLLPLARRLRAAGVPFRFTIYGTGELEAPMRETIRAHGLADVVRMPGAVDFHARLVPELRTGTDLFVMLHRQSDPSCTYLETLSCGVPIVGYDNRAFAGILDLADVGTPVRMDDIDGVVAAIAALHADRATLARQARNAVAFARGHTFEDTFRRRIGHLAAGLYAA